MSITGIPANHSCQVPLGDHSATNSSSDNGQSMNSKKGKSRKNCKACMQKKGKQQGIWKMPASALKALKQQLDKGLVPVHLFGFAEQPQAPSCVQRWREAALAPSGVWTFAHQLQPPAA